MHIVFVCDDTTRTGDATVSLCRALAEEFQARGHRVSFVGNCEHPQDPLEETVAGIRHHRFYYPINRITHEMLADYGRTHSLAGLALAMLRHPVTAAVDVLRALTGFNPIEGKYRRALERLDRREPVDLAIAGSGSFYTIHALAGARLKGLRVGYMLDPYWKNSATGGRRAEKEELYAWRRLDYMVIPPLLKEDYEDPRFDAVRHKRVCAEFPGIAPPAHSAGPEFPAERVNLLFAGNFYERIRSPEYLLELVAALPEEYCLHILGGIYGSFDDGITRRMDELSRQGRLVLHGAVPAAQARGAMARADLLVNIGNAIGNQLPSKIFEYFSTGKPVVHLQKIPDCPCAPYMARYGNAVTVAEDMPPREAAERIGAFRARGLETISFNRVRERFAECTAQYVAEQFLRMTKQE